MHYVVCLKNNNKGYGANFAHIKITGKKEDGSIGFSDDWTIGGLMPQGTTYWAWQAGDGSVTNNDTIDISVSVNKNDWFATTTVIPEDLYVFDNISVSTDDYGGLKATGEITLTDDSVDLMFNSVTSPMLVCVLKDEEGKLVGGFNGFIYTDLSSGNADIFEISSFNNFGNYSIAEMYANPW